MNACMRDWVPTYSDEISMACADVETLETLHSFLNGWGMRVDGCKVYKTRLMRLRTRGNGWR